MCETTNPLTLALLIGSEIPPSIAPMFRKDVVKDAKELVKRAAESFDQQILQLSKDLDIKTQEINRLEGNLHRMLPSSVPPSPSKLISKSVPSSPQATLLLDSPQSAPLSGLGPLRLPMSSSTSSPSSTPPDSSAMSSEASTGPSTPVETKRLSIPSTSTMSANVSPRFPSLAQVMETLENMSDKDNISVYFRELSNDYLTAIGVLHSQGRDLDEQIAHLNSKVQGLRLRMRNMSALCSQGFAIPEYSRHIQTLQMNSPNSAKSPLSSSSSATGGGPRRSAFSVNRSSSSTGVGSIATTPTNRSSLS